MVWCNSVLLLTIHAEHPLPDLVAIGTIWLTKSFIYIGLICVVFL